MTRGIHGLVLGYGSPPNPRRGALESMLDGMGISRCPKCNTHRRDGEDCPGCARIAAANYQHLIDIETGKR